MLNLRQAQVDNIESHTELVSVRHDSVSNYDTIENLLCHTELVSVQHDATDNNNTIEPECHPELVSGSIKGSMKGSFQDLNLKHNQNL